MRNFNQKAAVGQPGGEKPDVVCSERGELQLTASGISGIPVFQISRYATRALADEKHPYVLIVCAGSYGQGVF